MCMGIFQHDNVDRADVETLVDAFPGQSIDFFGALRARVYDDKVRPGRGSAGKGIKLTSLGWCACSFLLAVCSGLCPR